MFPIHLAAAELTRERDEAESSRQVAVLHLALPPPREWEETEAESPDWALFY